MEQICNMTMHHHNNHHHNYLNHHRRRQNMVAAGTVSLLVAFLLPNSPFSIRDVHGSGQRYDSFPTTWRLEFREDRQSSNSTSKLTLAKFKILQLADIHLGEAQDTEWGPRQDINTWRLLDRVIPMEKPDLIVLSGDQLTANNVDANATSYYRLLGQRLSYHGVPWAMVCMHVCG
jgi:Calcineurin-like phosphoesterase